MSGVGPGLQASGSMPVFDYDENDIETLEKEIEQVIRAGTAKTQQFGGDYQDDNLINLQTGTNKPKTANKRPLAGKRQRII